MTTPRLILLGVMTLIFILWAALLFRTMFQIRRRAAERTGRSFVGPGATLSEWRRLAKSAEDRRTRQWLLGTTLALLIWIISQALMAG